MNHAGPVDDGRRCARCGVAAWVLAASLAGCASAGLRGNVYDNGMTRFRIGSLAREWEAVEIGDNDLAYYHKALGTIGLNATCENYEDVPEQALVNHLLFGTTNRQFDLEETRTLDGRGARHLRVAVELDGVPVAIELFVLKKDGCIYDFSYISARPQPPSGHTAFIRFVEGFRTLER